MTRVINIGLMLFFAIQTTSFEALAQNLRQKAADKAEQEFANKDVTVLVWSNKERKYISQTVKGGDLGAEITKYDDMHLAHKKTVESVEKNIVEMNSTLKESREIVCGNWPWCSEGEKTAVVDERSFGAKTEIRSKLSQKPKLREAFENTLAKADNFTILEMEKALKNTEGALETEKNFRDAAEASRAAAVAAREQNERNKRDKKDQVDREITELKNWVAREGAQNDIDELMRRVEKAQIGLDKTKDSVTMIQLAYDDSLLGDYIMEKFGRLLSDQTLCTSIEKKCKGPVSGSDMKSIFPEMNFEKGQRAARSWGNSAASP